jgi:hypothetical protein
LYFKHFLGKKDHLRLKKRRKEKVKRRKGDGERGRKGEGNLTLSPPLPISYFLFLI